LISPTGTWHIRLKPVSQINFISATSK